MSNYFLNLRLWLTGFGKLGTIAYKPGWSPWKFFPVYLLDCGMNVLTGGAVCPLSRRFQDHRSGWVWDKILDVIETFDKYHGLSAGPPLFGSVECSKRVQIFVTLAWLATLFLWQ
jgi:hypothetical protein